MFTTKLGIFLCLTVAIVYAANDYEDIPVPGGVRQLKDFKDAERILNRSLTTLAAGEGPSYKIGKIYSATAQTVAGELHKIVADLIDDDGKTKKCNIIVLSQEWLPNGIQITFECPNEPAVTKKHSA